MKYVSIPKEIEAVQFTGNNLNEIIMYLDVSEISIRLERRPDAVASCIITTKLGVKLVALQGDYITKDNVGNISIIKSDIFEKDYIKKE